MKIKVSYSVELSDRQIEKQAIPMLCSTGYLARDNSDSKREVSKAARRFCTDWGYTEFMKKISQYTAGF